MGREEHCKYHWCVLTVIQPHWVCPCSQRVCLPSLHCSGSRLLCRELSEACPVLYALPRSKLLRFRYSGTPQRRRLGWACVLCPSQVRAAQETRRLVSTLSKWVVAYHLLCPRCLVSWVCSGSAVSGVLCVSSRELIFSGRSPPGVCQPSRIPGRLG